MIVMVSMIPVFLAAMIALGSLVFTILSKVIADEFKEWLPWLNEYFLRIGLAALPQEIRLEEERKWRSHINDIPGVGTKALVAARIALYPVVRAKYGKTIATGIGQINAAMEALMTGCQLRGRNGRRHLRVAIPAVIYGSVALLLLPVMVGPEDAHLQKGPMQLQLVEGSRLYRATCAGCHELRAVEMAYLKGDRKFRNGAPVNRRVLVRARPQ